MRITNSTILRGYNRNLNRLQNAKTSSEHKILTGRQFDRASESPLAAAKALNVRKSLYETAQYKENLDVASKFYTEAETTLLKVSEELAGIRETIIAAVNSSKDPATDMQIYAQQLETKASELCSIFNTDTAERVIFGGESNDPQPFKIQDGVVLYHDVPVNASTDPKSFPYSEDIYIDIGIGFVQNQTTQKIDPQSALKISFNGADVTGCGSEVVEWGEDKPEKGTCSAVADFNLNSLNNGQEYVFDIYVDGQGKKTITYTYDGDITSLKDAIDAEFDPALGYTFEVSEEGIVSATNDAGAPVSVTMVNNAKSEEKAEIKNSTGYTDYFTINLDKLETGKEYGLEITAYDSSNRPITKTLTFTAEASALDNVNAINNAIADAFSGTDANYPMVNEKGLFNAEGSTVSVKSIYQDEAVAPEVKRDQFFSKNYIQLTLDAAKALRNGDMDYANGCIDKIVSATENLLVEIADLGCNEEYIDFTIERYDTRELNLKERQKTLEATDLESEITLMKTYEALYNAALQMSSTVVPNSIFNYIS